jgi:hypothetical protein
VRKLKAKEGVGVPKGFYFLLKTWLGEGGKKKDEKKKSEN